MYCMLTGEGANLVRWVPALGYIYVSNQGFLHQLGCGGFRRMECLASKSKTVSVRRDKFGFTLYGLSGQKKSTTLHVSISRSSFFFPFTVLQRLSRSYAYESGRVLTEHAGVILLPIPHWIQCPDECDTVETLYGLQVEDENP